jgi:lysophospholipase L1-like esterase
MPLVRRTKFILAGAVFAGTLALVVAEITVRAVAAGSRSLRAELRGYDLLGIRVEPHATVGYRPKPNTVWRYDNGATANINPTGYRGPAVPAVRTAGVRRVVLLGGSSTFGWGVNDDETVGAALRSILGSDARVGSLEVINAAFDGYDSYQLVERLRSDVVALRPDVVVVNAGANDVRSAGIRAIADGDERTLIWAEPMRHARAMRDRGGPSIGERVMHAWFTLRFALLVRDRLLALARGGRGADGSPPPASPPHWDSADYFERNLRTIGRIAARHGFALVLSSEPSALRLRHAPGETSTISYWHVNAGVTALYRDTLSMRMSRVAGDLERAGQRVAFVRAAVPAAGFLDDVHLTPAGNRALAEALAPAIRLCLGEPPAATEGDER